MHVICLTALLLFPYVSTFTITRGREGDFSGTACSGTWVINPDNYHSLKCLKYMPEMGCDLQIDSDTPTLPGFVPEGAKNTTIDIRPTPSSATFCEAGFSPSAGKILVQDYPYNVNVDVWVENPPSVALLVNNITLEGSTDKVKLTFREDFPGLLIKLFVRCVKGGVEDMSANSDKKCVVIKYGGTLKLPLNETVFIKPPLPQPQPSTTYIVPTTSIQPQQQTIYIQTTAIQPTSTELTSTFIEPTSIEPTSILPSISETQTTTTPVIFQTAVTLLPSPMASSIHTSTPLLHSKAAFSNSSHIHSTENTFFKTSHISLTSTSFMHGISVTFLPNTSYFISSTTSFINYFKFSSSALIPFLTTPTSSSLMHFDRTSFLPTTESSTHSSFNHSTLLLHTATLVNLPTITSQTPTAVTNETSEVFQGFSPMTSSIITSSISENGTFGRIRDGPDYTIPIVVAGVIGGIAITWAVILVIIFCCKCNRRRRKNNVKTAQSEYPNPFDGYKIKNKVRTEIVREIRPRPESMIRPDSIEVTVTPLPQQRSPPPTPPPSTPPTLPPSPGSTIYEEPSRIRARKALDRYTVFIGPEGVRETVHTPAASNNAPAAGNALGRSNEAFDNESVTSEELFI